MRHNRRRLRAAFLLAAGIPALWLAAYTAARMARDHTVAQLRAAAEERDLAYLFDDATTTLGTIEPVTASLVELAQSWDDDSVYAELSDQACGTPAIEWPEEVGRRLVALFEERSQEIALIRAGAPGFRMAAPGVTLDSDTLLRCCTAARTLSRVLGLDMALCVRRGDIDGALAGYRARVLLSEAVGTYPSLAVQTTRVSLSNMAFHGFADTFPAGTLSEAQTRAMVDFLAGRYRRDLFECAWIGCAAEGVANFGPPTPDAADAFLDWLTATAPFRPWHYWEEHACAELPLRLVESARAPRFAMPSEYNARSPSGLDVMRDMMTFTFRLSQASQAEVEASVDLTRIGLLIEDHHHRHGTYPERLSALAGDLGGAVPLDPFFGNPYRYRPSEDGFLLYSVGANGTDDGGKPDKLKGDWVWRGQ